MPTDESGFYEEGNTPSNDHNLIGEQIRHQQLSARVPEHIARGVFSTGAIVTHGPHEFVIDFLLSMSRPHQISARVIMVPQVVAQMINALQENLRRYEQRFGPIIDTNKVDKPDAPKTPSEPGSGGGGAAQEAAGSGAPGVVSGEGAEAAAEAGSERQPSVQEIYDDLRIPDDVISGAYANAVMIGHSAGEFFFDFITNFYPRSAVCCRVYLSSRQVPRLLDALRFSFQRMQARQKQGKPRKPRDEDTPPQPPEAPQPPTELA